MRTVYQGNAFLFGDVQFVRVDCEDTQSLLLFLKYFYIHGFVLISDNRRAEGVSGDVDSGSCHVEETVNAHNERDGFRRKADGSEDHCQCDKADARNACGTDGGQCCCEDDSGIIGWRQRDAESL